MDSRHEKLLKEFEDFEEQLKVDEILEKVKAEWVLDSGVTEFGELLKERECLKQAAQATRTARATRLHQLCYPQLTCEWFVKGLDFCCPYWRYQFKRPLTPPPAPPLPSPDAAHQTYQTPRQTSSAKRRQPRRTHHRDGYHQRRRRREPR